MQNSRAKFQRKKFRAEISTGKSCGKNGSGNSVKKFLCKIREQNFNGKKLRKKRKQKFSKKISCKISAKKFAREKFAKKIKAKIQQKNFMQNSR
jgi:hypothetical protein